ncbi:MAG: hypothetical protein AUI85_05795, partial [Acidobacteriales bacterium 13_1_40CM_3_55_5]
MRATRIVFLFVLLAILLPSLTAQTNSREADIKAAVDAYLAKMPPAQRARSNAYFEGGYWLLLIDFIYTILVMRLLLRLRSSAKMRNFAGRITRSRFLQPAVYWIQFIIAVALLTFPLTVYEAYYREHKYGLLNQTFGPWLREQLIMLAVNLVLGAIFLTLLFWVVRRLGKNWWIWSAVVAIILQAFVVLIAPVYIFPLFNTYKKLEDARVRDPILSMARANGIPATEVYEFDASRQSNRVSANVSGFGSTMRISLNDNLLKRCTLPEIETVMGHEMGHYVLNHTYKGLVMLGVLFVIGFAFLNWGIHFALARWGEQWGIAGITDVAVLPVASAVIAIYFFLMTPVTNTITRTMEYEADMYGLNAAQ